MKKEILVLWLTALIVLFIATGLFAQEASWQDLGKGNVNFTTVLVDSDTPQCIYAGVGSSVIKIEEGSMGFRVLMNISGENNEINSLEFAVEDKNSLYAATGNGLFASFDKGEHWKKIFQGKNNLEKQCTSLAALPTAIFLGTKAGLFVSRDKGRSWHKETAQLGSCRIFAIAYCRKNPQYLFVACDKGIFKGTTALGNWERLFVAAVPENSFDQEGSENEDALDQFYVIRYICADPNNVNNLYLATSRGILKSSNQGCNWETISNSGLLDKEVSFLAISPVSGLAAVTKSGIFEYGNARWEEVSLRLTAKKINYIAMDSLNNIYAACDNGLFKSKPNFVSRDGQNIVSIYYKNEPRIEDVQKAAVEYAEVAPEKIKRWRDSAARKALLPQVSVDFDRNVTDLWHWETGSSTKSDDDTLRKGNDCVAWRLALTWNLGELIWNNDQTSIDVRSKLMVELRNDILDQVTKIYFERLRIKMDLDNISIEDRKKRLEKELRLRELTASIDALTGGYFSRQSGNKQFI